jgi:LacI family transcriptional regulator
MIAELSGASRGTVNRVLHKRGNVNPETARRIEDTAKALHYRPNTVAKSLATQRRNIKICVILHIQGNLFFDDVVRGVEQAAAEIKDFGIAVTVRRGANFDVECQLRNIDDAVREGCRAIILVPINDPRITSRLNELHDRGVPVIFLTSYLERTACLCHVGCDYFKAGCIAAELFNLVSGGRGSIGIVTPPFTLLGVNLRIQGLRSAIEQEYPDMRLVALREVPGDERLAYSYTHDMLREHPEMDCLFYSIGGLSSGLKAIAELDHQRRLRIVSLDLIQPIVNAVKSGMIMATICQEPIAQGYTAIKVAFDHLVARTEPAMKNILIDPSIKIRQSFHDTGLSGTVLAEPDGLAHATPDALPLTGSR